MGDDFGFGNWPGPPEWEAAKELASKARRAAFLEAAEMTEDAAQTCLRGQKEVLLAMATRLRAKAEET